MLLSIEQLFDYHVFVVPNRFSIDSHTTFRVHPPPSSFIIHMGPVALMLLSIIAAMGCYHEITIISYNVHRASNVPWIRSLCYYYLFTLLYLFYGDSIARHVNDALIAANDNAVDVIDASTAPRDDVRNDAIAAAAAGIPPATSVVVSGGVGGISDFLESVERFHPTTSFVLYVIGLAAGFLPLTIKAAKRGVGGKKRRSKGGGTGESSTSSVASALPPSRLEPHQPPSNSSSATALLKKQFVIFAWSHMALLLILFPSHFAVVNIAVGGHLWFLIPVSIVIFNDIAAYVFGFCFGKLPFLIVGNERVLRRIKFPILLAIITIR